MNTPFHKLPECDHCTYFTGNSRLCCAVHPSGVEGDRCHDFVDDASFAAQLDALLQWPWDDEFLPDSGAWNPEGFWTLEEADYQRFERSLDGALQQRWREIDGQPRVDGRLR